MSNRLTSPSGVAGTYPWLIRELSHHPELFSAEDIVWFFDNQPRINPRWRAVLCIRDAGIALPLPSAIVDRIVSGESFLLDGEEVTFNGLHLT